MSGPLDNRNLEYRQALIATLTVQGLEVQEEHRGNIWNLSMSLTREEGIWLSMASASHEAGYDTELQLAVEKELI